MSEEGNYIFDFGKLKQISQIKKLIKLLKQNGLSIEEGKEIIELKQELNNAGILGSLDSFLMKLKMDI